MSVFGPSFILDRCLIKMIHKEILTEHRVGIRVKSVVENQVFAGFDKR